MERPVNVTRPPRAEDELLERQEVPAAELETPPQAPDGDPDIGDEFTTSGTSREDWARDRAKGWNLKAIDDAPLL